MTNWDDARIEAEAAKVGEQWDGYDALAAEVAALVRRVRDDAARLVEEGIEYSDGDGLRTLDPRGLKVLAAAIRGEKG